MKPMTRYTVEIYVPAMWVYSLHKCLYESPTDLHCSLHVFYPFYLVAKLNAYRTCMYVMHTSTQHHSTNL